VSGEQPLSGSVINPSSVVIAGSTIAAGASAVQLQGHQVSLNPAASNVVVDGQGHALPVPNSSPLTQVGNVPSPKLIATTVDGHNIQAASVSGVILIDGQSVTRGADRILVASTPITLQTNGDLVVAASTIHSLVPPSPNSPSVFTAAGQPATVLSNGIAIAGTTLTPNAPAISISGTPISLGTDGLVIGTSIIPVPTPAPGTLITAAGQAVTALANGNIVIAGTTLAPNAAVVTISGTPISLGTNGLIVGTSTIALPTTQAMQSITIGRQLLFMSLDTSDVVVAGTTLQLGQPAVTIAGTPVSLGTFGLVIGTSTISLPSSDSSQGIGGFIFSGFNGGPAAPSTTGVAGSTQQQINSTQNGNMVAFLGGAAKAMSRWSTFIIPTIVVCILLLT